MLARLAIMTDLTNEKVEAEESHTDIYFTSEDDMRAKERRLVLKIDRRVIPWLFATYSFSLIDRTNISAAKVVGMQQDLRLVGTQYNSVLVLFFLTYILAEIPSNVMFKPIGPKIYLSFLLISWGSVAMCFGFVENYSQLLALRLLLGLFEGGFNVCSLPPPPLFFFFSSSFFS
jgi:sugar phosphate permease